MKLRILISTILALVFLTAGAAPAFAASPEPTWLGGPGEAEPNTAYDTSGFIWQEPNQEAVERIYFNGIITRASLLAHAYFQLDGGSVETSEAMVGIGLLGYWRDCNADGYIGNKLVPANYGFWGSYPRATLTSDQIEAMQDRETGTCPIETPYNNPETSDYINEFRAIGPDAQGEPYGEDRICGPREDPVDTAFACYGAAIDQVLVRKGPHNVNDTESQVWFDFGAPDAIAGQSRSVQERGFMQTSDGTLESLDFTLGFALRNLLEDGDVTVAGEVVDGPALGLWSSKPNMGDCNENHDLMSGSSNTCGLYPLYQAKRLVNDSNHEDDRAEPLVKVYDEESDCDANPITVSEDITIDGVGTVYGTVYTRTLDPEVHANPLTRGSIGGTYVNVMEGTANYDRDEEECAQEYGFTNLEQGQSSTSKTRTYGMFYVIDWRTRALKDVGMDDVNVDGFGTVPGAYWTTYHLIFFVPPSGGTLSYRFGASFYAHVSDQAFSENGQGADPTFSLPAGAESNAPFEYGSDQCDGNYESGEVSDGGWLCDKSVWEQRLVDDGLEASAFPVVGDPYSLRDVDCYDSTLFRQGDIAGPRASLAQIDCSYAPYGDTPLPDAE